MIKTIMNQSANHTPEGKSSRRAISKSNNTK